MKSDIINIDSLGNGFAGAVEETAKVAAYAQLDEQETRYLKLITEEILSLLRSVTGEIKANFGIENEGKSFQIHVSTTTTLDDFVRSDLLSSATSGKNEFAKGFFGAIRDMIDQAFTPEGNRGDNISSDEEADLAGREFKDADWDGYERSVLRHLADNVKIGIRGNRVEAIVYKKF